MLLEIAIGDAYGAGFEFCGREKIERHNNLASYVPHECGMEAGLYTDDTQMSVAVAEVLLDSTDWTSDAFADAFVRCYKRNPRMGYAKGLQGLLDNCASGGELRTKIHPASLRNGAAMRSVPLGLIPDERRLLETARAQAMVTHDTPAGILSSQVIALMAHQLVHKKAAIADLPRVVQRETSFEMRADWTSNVECDAIQTVHAVSTALLRNRRMSDLLRDCVNFGGDVDSVAAIAMGLASLTGEYTHDIPPQLQLGLESGKYGSGFLAQLDTTLAAHFLQ